MLNRGDSYVMRELSRSEWDGFWSQVDFANLMQSWEYGEAKRSQNWRANRFLIQDSSGEPFALIQVLVKAVPLIGGIARVNRGPVYLKALLEQEVDGGEVELLWKAIRKMAWKRRWWILSVAPELSDGDAALSALNRAGFKRKDKVPWGSTRISLHQEKEQLLRQLKGKWRNLLRKGEKLGTTVECVDDHATVEGLIQRYIEFQKMHAFVGVPEELLKSLSRQTGNHFAFKVYQTCGLVEPYELSGFIFVVYHGDTATYLVGWSSDEGRKQQANYLLLWQGIVDAMDGGLKWFDMGGLNQNTPKGITHFKQGLNGIPYQLVGEF